MEAILLLIVIAVIVGLCIHADNKNYQDVRIRSAIAHTDKQLINELARKFAIWHKKGYEPLNELVSDKYSYQLYDSSTMHPLINSKLGRTVSDSELSEILAMMRYFVSNNKSLEFMEAAKLAAKQNGWTMKNPESYSLENQLKKGNWEWHHADNSNYETYTIYGQNGKRETITVKKH